MPQPVHTVSNVSDTSKEISLFSDASISHLALNFLRLLHHKSRTTPLINPPQGPISNIERLLSQEHWNHSFNIVNSSPSFQSSLLVNFPGTTPIITLSSNSPDADQHSHHCIGNHPDITRSYTTLPLELDLKFIVPPPALFGGHKNGEKFHNWAKQRISKSYKITPLHKQKAHDRLKQSKIIFSVEIVVEQDKLIFQRQAAAPPIFRVKINPSPSIFQEFHYKFDRYTKNTAGYFAFYNPHSGLSCTCPLQI